MSNAKIKKEEHKIANAIDSIKNYATDTYEKVSETTAEKAKLVDDTVKENPWKSVGVAAATGTVVGMMLGKKSK